MNLWSHQVVTKWIKPNANEYNNLLLHFWIVNPQTWQKLKWHLIFSGFLRFKPDTSQVSLLLSHNFGLSTIEEGYLEGKCLTLKSTSISRMEFAKEPRVTELQRSFQLVDENILLQTVFMATSKTSLTKHLEARYVRI